MEKKSMLQLFREAAPKEQAFAERIVKILAFNRIYTVDILLSKTDTDIYAISGIGPRAMNIIARVKTRAQAERMQMEEAYKKQCKTCKPVSLKDWFKQIDLNHLSACKLEHILRNNGIKTVDDFMNASQQEIGSFKGIGPKYLQACFETKGLISSSKTKKKRDAR